MKKLIASLLISLMAALPLVAEQNPPPQFNFGQVVTALSPEDAASLITQARQALNLPEEYYDVTIDQVIVDGTTPPTDNSIVVEEPGQAYNAVALGCAVIIVAVSIVVWGVVIYIIYRVCKKSSPPLPPPPATSTNAPPAHPPIFPPIV